ncbi:lantibiotic dehydratase family protein [Chryseobacterium shigense]|uniref:Lantibiotic dehydratase N-terminal domain-containing protein n=1 Tax=Chryseobacterium shigense TaxID=297244 RepID=A0A841NC26_9FLAO|nr:lantibiotic dehydratase family protein [Chryseobacterium shigense]MBB6372573.1 hypothetical protein [Chryseobacterium shigense]
MSRFPYQFLEEFIVRTPLFSLKSFREKLGDIYLSDQELGEICHNSVFQEAIYLASPYLYEELMRWLGSENELSANQHQKLKNTILKYYNRMSTRCTPFGLFSEVGSGEFANNAGLSYIDGKHPITDNKVRDTKLDMHFLVGLAHYFVTVPEIRNRLLFYPNNSIYTIGNKIRYIEYQYTSGKRDYIISSAPLSDEIQHILDFSAHGKTITQIAGILVNDEINKEEAEEFINELIDNQVLVSELEPTVSGNDFLDTIISVLNRRGAENKAQTLISVKDHLNRLDLKLGNSISVYTEIERLIRSVFISAEETSGEPEYEKKYLFQTDLYFQNTIYLSSHWKKELKNGISFLNKLTLLNKNSHLEEFRKAFYDRFEAEEMPLAYVLDMEVGIGYRQDISVKGLHPYLEDLKTSGSKKKQELHIQLNPVQVILNQKLQEALSDKEYTIKLSDEDFNDFEINWNDLPDTMSIMAEIISEDSREKLVLNGGGGSSAANLLGRFCSEKSRVQHMAKVIVGKEEKLNPDYVVAEIIHLPEARIGNVIRRPNLRHYEIPYLAQSTLPEENQIPIDDLYISLRNNRIVLRSKKLNKEIKPYLTNVHNYYTNTLPVYHFLSDLHSQDSRTALYFNWGGLSEIYQFLPRVEYKNIILSKAQWKVTEKEIGQFSPLINNKKELLAELKNWRKKRQIPQWIQWVKSDNKLTVNLENSDLVNMFIDAIKNQKSIIIEEFLYNENDDFKREFIFPMYKVNQNQ